MEVQLVYMIDGDPFTSGGAPTPKDELRLVILSPWASDQGKGGHMSLFWYKVYTRSQLGRTFFPK